MDPLLHGPFRFHEAFRTDLRPRSPLTRLTVRAHPAVPVLGDPDQNLVLLGEYRYDDLRPTSGTRVGPLHRGELGANWNRRVTPDLAFNLDARAVFATSPDGPDPSAWYPNLRVGLTWSLAPNLSASVAVFWSRTLLGLVPLPILGLYYEAPDRRFRLDVLAPRYLELAGRPGPRVELFGVAHWETLVWSVAEATSTSTANGVRSFLVRQEVRAQAGLRVFVTGPIAVEVGAQWIPWQLLTVGNVRDRPASLDDVALTVGIAIDKVGLRRQGFADPS